MEIDVRALLEESPLLLLFTTIGLGYLLGNIKFGRIEVGSTAGVLLVGLAFGHYGLTIEPLFGTFGFTLFIFWCNETANIGVYTIIFKTETNFKTISISWRIYIVS